MLIDDHQLIDAFSANTPDYSFRMSILEEGRQIDEVITATLALAKCLCRTNTI
jgi:hypothetical protein